MWFQNNSKPEQQHCYLTNLTSESQKKLTSESYFDTNIWICSNILRRWIYEEVTKSLLEYHIDYDYFLFFNSVSEAGDKITIVESLQYSFDTISIATDNFSVDNKLGKGGFGAVYKVIDH